MRILSVLGVSVLAAGCAAPALKTVDPSIEAPGGPVPADFSLCDMKPAPSACDIPTRELTAETARERLDAEYARLRRASPRFARKLAVDSFAAAELPANSPLYALLRDRAWKAAFQAPEAAGKRFLMLMSVGHTAFRGGDVETAQATIEQSRKLIRRRHEDHRWKVQIADVIMAISRERAWSWIEIAAAEYGKPGLALEVLHEAFPPSERKTHRYYLRLAAIKLKTKEYGPAEAAARRAVKTAPYRFDEVREVFRDTKVEAYKYLLESLARQGKSTNNTTQKLFDYVTSFPTYLSGHAFNFIALSDDLAPFAPEAARRFLTTGQEIRRIHDDEKGFPSRITETTACKALGDEQCLLRIAKQKEAALNPESPFGFGLVASAYAEAGDLRSAKRLIKTPGPGRCRKFAYMAVVRRLKDHNELGPIPGWLRDWARCQMREDPNYSTGYGEGGNDWSWIALNYSLLSRWQREVGRTRVALHSAKMALLLAIETENTWKLDLEKYRAESFARAYGSALGALARAEAAMAAR